MCWLPHIYRKFSRSKREVIDFLSPELNNRFYFKFYLDTEIQWVLKWMWQKSHDTSRYYSGLLLFVFYVTRWTKRVIDKERKDLSVKLPFNNHWIDFYCTGQDFIVFTDKWFNLSTKVLNNREDTFPSVLTLSRHNWETKGNSVCQTYLFVPSVGERVEINDRRKSFSEIVRRWDKEVDLLDLIVWILRKKKASDNSRNLLYVRCESF